MRPSQLSPAVCSGAPSGRAAPPSHMAAESTVEPAALDGESSPGSVIAVRPVCYAALHLGGGVIGGDRAVVIESQGEHHAVTHVRVEGNVQSHAVCQPLRRCAGLRTSVVADLRRLLCRDGRGGLLDGEVEVLRPPVNRRSVDYSDGPFAGASPTSSSVCASSSPSALSLREPSISSSTRIQLKIPAASSAATTLLGSEGPRPTTSR